MFRIQGHIVLTKNASKVGEQYYTSFNLIKAKSANI